MSSDPGIMTALASVAASTFLQPLETSFVRKAGRKERSEASSNVVPTEVERKKDDELVRQILEQQRLQGERVRQEDQAEHLELERLEEERIWRAREIQRQDDERIRQSEEEGPKLPTPRDFQEWEKEIKLQHDVTLRSKIEGAQHQTTMAIIRRLDSGQEGEGEESSSELFEKEEKSIAEGLIAVPPLFKLVFLAVFGITLLSGFGAAGIAFASGEELTNNQQSVFEAANTAWKMGVGVVFGMLGGKAA